MCVQAVNMSLHIFLITVGKDKSRKNAHGISWTTIGSLHIEQQKKKKTQNLHSSTEKHMYKVYTNEKYFAEKPIKECTSTRPICIHHNQGTTKRMNEIADKLSKLM
jgi:hypothetical protein